MFLLYNFLLILFSAIIILFLLFIYRRETSITSKRGQLWLWILFRWLGWRL